MSNSIQSKLNLAEMAQGAFMEQFHRELNQVLANIADPNTDPKKARKITLTMTLKPEENREVVTVETQSKSTLVPPKPLGTTNILDRDHDGSVVGADLKSGQKGQMYMNQDMQIRDDRGKVVTMQR